MLSNILCVPSLRQGQEPSRIDQCKRALEPKIPQLHYIDNIDPDAFVEIFNSFEAAHTGYIVISKSGETAETLMQLLVIADFYQKHHPTLFLPHHFTVVTEEKDSSLMRLAKMWSLPVLPHHPKIGGRFSVSN